MTRTFMVFILVGILNTAVGYSLFALFIFLGVHYSLAVLFATILGVLFNFKSIGHIVFKNSDNRLIFKFVLVYVVNYLLNIAGLRILSEHGVDMYFAGALMILPLAGVAFLLHRNLVFRKSAKDLAHAAD
jgi:putative flippase GtrA